MQRHLFNKLTWRPELAQFTQRREMHSRNKKAMELIAKGWSALKEVDRVTDYCELNDCRLIALLRVHPAVGDLIEPGLLRPSRSYLLAQLGLPNRPT